MRKNKNKIFLISLIALFVFIPLKNISAEDCRWYETAYPSNWQPSNPPLDAGEPPSGPDNYLGDIYTQFNAGDADFYCGKEINFVSYGVEWIEKKEYHGIGSDDIAMLTKECCRELYNTEALIYNENLDYISEFNINHRECWEYTDVWCCPPPSCQISASPSSITSDQSATLTWSSEGATSVKNSNFGASGTQGIMPISPSATKAYQLTVQNDSGQIGYCETTVTVQEPYTPPTISGPCHDLVPCKDNCTLNDIFLMIRNIVNCLVYLSTIVCLLFIVIGGLLYIFSLGNPEMSTKAKNTILWAIGGLALVFLAWLIVNTIMAKIFDYEGTWHIIG